MLSKIWDMADPQSRGALDKTGMFVALKLCAFAQLGRELNIANLSQDVAPPKMVSFLSCFSLNFLNYKILKIDKEFSCEKIRLIKYCDFKRASYRR